MSERKFKLIIIDEEIEKEVFHHEFSYINGKLLYLPNSHAVKECIKKHCEVESEFDPLLYYYDTMFWNEEIDDGFVVRFLAPSHFQAERIMKEHSVKGYFKGECTYVGKTPKNREYIIINIKQLKELPLYQKVEK